MLTYILIGVAVLVAILVIVVSMQPSEFRALSTLRRRKSFRT
jgi:preprotein translocase subunit SecG